MIRIPATLKTLFAQPNFTGLLGSSFVLGVAFSFVAPFLSKWGTEELDLTPSRFSLFMTLVSLAAIVVSTVLARLSDTQFSRRQMLAAGSVSGVLGFVGYAFVRDIWLLLFIGCTVQAIASVCFAQLFSHAREVYGAPPASGPDRSSFTMSVVRVCFSFAWTLGPALGAFALLAFGFQGLFVSAAALYLLFFLGTLRFVPHRPASKPVANVSTPSLLSTLRDPRLLLPFVAFASLFAANSINMMNLPLAITLNFNGTERDFGIVFGIGPLAEIPLMLLFGHLASRGYQFLLIKLGFFITLSYFILLFVATQPWHVYLIQILSGAAFAILTNIAIGYFQDLAPKQMGLATSLFSNSGAVGNLVGLLSFGFIVEALGNRNAFLVCAALTAVGLALIPFAKPKTASARPCLTA
ncbi:sugar efflux transporter [Pelagicoccus sp. SDUM812003]|uniref:sugar efflux transporter n=1 Tax=Pelagicoccus sp. SDUM812003 TaxID=3041267 RepID=UPI00280E80C5|nr:sugar efflux transporter [Pelagicoccus sp. SDUM812003]MDQ8203215.1 sugar efflux transporter [Pelagicoccus sp. SDUM812003]